MRCMGETETQKNFMMGGTKQVSGSEELMGVRKERGWVARAKAPRKEELQVHWTGW